MPTSPRPGRGTGRKLAVSLLLSALLVVLLLWLVPSMKKDNPDGPRDETASRAAPEGGSPQAPGAKDAASRTESRATVEAAKEGTSEESPPAELPPLLRGRVTGEGTGIEGAVVHLFGAKKVEDLLERLEAMVPDAGEFPDIEALLGEVREELNRFRTGSVAARTAKDGLYEVRGIETGAYFVLTLGGDAPSVSPSPEGGWLFRYGDVVSLSADKTEVLDMTLQRGARISGRVVDTSGQAVPGAKVVAEPRPLGIGGLGVVFRRLLRYVNGEFIRGPFEAVSGSDGTFALSALLPGVYDVSAARIEGVEARISQVETGTTEALICLGEPASLQGRLADGAGYPAPGVAVLLERQEDIIQVQLPMAGFDKVASRVNRWLGGGPKRAVSGPKGEFRIAPLAPGRWKLQVEERGFLPFERDVDFDWDEKLDIGLLRLDRGQELKGYVRSAPGQPIEGAKVTATAAKANFLTMGATINDFLSGRIVAHTTSAGEFRLGGLPKGSYRVIATASGCVPGVKKDVETGGEPILFELEPGARVTGIVLAGDGKTPIAEAKVRARESRARTDAEGRFVLEGVAPEDPDLNPFANMVPMGAAAKREERAQVKVTATADGYVAGETQIDLAQGKKEVEIRLDRIPEVFGVVLDPDGKPSPGSLVRITPSMPEGIPMPLDFLDSGMIFLAAGVTDLEGRFRFKTIKGASDDGRYRVLATHILHTRGISETFRLEDLPASAASPASPAAATDAKPGEEPGAITVQLTRGAVVKGVVTDGARPVPGATVRLAKAPKKKKGPEEQFGAFLGLLGLPKGGDVVYTDRDGRFEHSHVLPGDYVLGAEGTGFIDSPSEPLSLAPGDVKEVTLTVNPGGEIPGWVVNAADEPLAAARVRLLREPPAGDQEQKGIAEAQKLFGGAYKSARPGDDGAFRFTGLPAGTYALIAEHPGCVRHELGGLEPGKEQRVVLQRSAAIAGLVADAGSGEPVRQFRVRASKEGEGEGANPFAFFGEREYGDAEGRFIHGDLAAGTYDVKVSAAGYAPARSKVVVVAGRETPEKFLLAQAGRIRGAVVEAETGLPIAGARIALTGGSPAGTQEAAEAGPDGAGDAPARREARKARRAAERAQRAAESKEGGGGAGDDDRQAFGEAMAETWGASVSANTREDGAFLLEGVPEGQQRVVVSHDDYIPDARDGLEVAAGNEIEATFRLRSGIALSGKVVGGEGTGQSRMVFARGAGEANRHVRKSSMSAPDGTFRIRGLEPGPYRVFALGNSGGERFEPVEVDLDADRSGLEVPIPAGE